ncbi:hypothetical protein V8F06_002297 [Rhypophila decipiens]
MPARVVVSPRVCFLVPIVTPTLFPMFNSFVFLLFWKKEALASGSAGLFLVSQGPPTSEVVSRARRQDQLSGLARVQPSYGDLPPQLATLGRRRAINYLKAVPKVLKVGLVGYLVVVKPDNHSGMVHTSGTGVLSLAGDHIL